MNVNSAAPFLRLSEVAVNHRSAKAAGFKDGLEPVAGDPAKTAGKASQSPAFKARALIAGDPTLGEGPFGHLVSQIARGLLPAAPAPDPVSDPATDPAPDPVSDPGVDAGAADPAPVDVTV